MIGLIFPLLKNLNFSFLTGHSSPFIDVQPTIILSKYNSQCPTDDRIEITPSLTGIQNRNIHLALEFSVNRNLSIRNYSIVRGSHLIFGNIEITLKRYRCKTDSGEYIEPETILLPAGTKEIHGFRMMAASVSNRTNVHKIKPGCQLVSIFHYNMLLKENISKGTLKNIIENFKSLLGISSDSAEQYGFKFTLKLQNRGVINDTTIHVICTNMFKIIFDESNCCVETKEVDEIEYYLEK